MTTWILIILLHAHGGAVTMQQFGDERSCNTAAYAVKQLDPDAETICTPYESMK